MKIKISILWILFLPIFYVTHLYKVLFFLFLLMSIHEMMHIVCAIQLRYKIEKVIVYPFGLSATIQDFEYKNSWHELCITLSGLGVHILAAFFMPALSFFFHVSPSFLSYMQNANLSLLLFNALPIYPLDGGRIIRNILELVFPFKQAKKISLLTSIIIFFICIFYFPFNKSQIFLFLVLFSFQYIILMKEYMQDIHSFYLYRYIQGCHKKLKIHHKNDLYKNFYNGIIKNGRIRSEKDVLREWI